MKIVRGNHPTAIPSSQYYTFFNNNFKINNLDKDNHDYGCLISLTINLACKFITSNLKWVSCTFQNTIINIKFHERLFWVFFICLVNFNFVYIYNISKVYPSFMTCYCLQKYFFIQALPLLNNIKDGRNTNLFGCLLSLHGYPTTGSDRNFTSCIKQTTSTARLLRKY